MPDDAVKLSQSATKSLFGLNGTKNGDPDKSIDSIRSMQRFTPSEISAYSRALYVAPETQHPNIQGSGIISYLKPIHQEIGNKRIQVEKMKALAPEIEQSRILVSSSILSPNDLQDGLFSFSFENIPAINNDPHLAEEISEVFNQFFNQELQLGIKSYDWIGDIQYGGGSKPVLILPIATHLEVRNRDSADVRKDLEAAAISFPFGNGNSKNVKQPGMESFSSYCKRLKLEDDYLYSGIRGRNCTWKNVLESNTVDADLQEMVPAMESFGVRVPTMMNPSAARRMDDSDYGTEYVAGLESMIANLRTRLEEGDVIRVSENPEILRFARETKLQSKTEMMNALKDKYKKDNAFKYIIREELVDLKSNPDDYEHQGHPTIIELPAESVIPIHIPGAPQEHLGYFILLDQHGQPLTIFNSGMLNNETSCNDGGQVNASYEAIFGSGCCSSRYFSKQGAIQAAGNMIFNHMLDKYLKSRMNGIFGRNDLSLSRFNAVASTLFYRLLERKDTVLVFAPPELLHYFAFAYDDVSGYGISKLHDIEFLLSLRTTYLVANIIAMANDAVQQKIVNVGVDDKQANLEALLDMVAQIFVAKQKVNGSIDPSEIIRDIYSNSLVIVPKNVPGLSDFSVEVSNNSNTSNRVDNELMEQLTNLLVSQLDVPPAALNQLSEPEYAKSLVTYNLFFAKKIMRYQRIYCSQMTDFVRDYATFSVPFQKALAKKLMGNTVAKSTPKNKISKDKKAKGVKQTVAPSPKQTHIPGKTPTKDKLPPKVAAMLKDNPNVYSADSVDKLVSAIISGVIVKLPKPNIVVDNAQFEQIRNYTSNLNEMADMFYPQDLVPSDDQDASTALPVVKAMWKRQQLAKFISQIGSYSLTEIPDDEDVNPDNITDFLQVLQNTNKAMVQQREAIAAASSSGSEGDSGFGSYGGDDSGMDDDMGGFGGEEMDAGGEDFGSAETEDMEMPDEASESVASEESTTVATTSEEGEAPTMQMKQRKSFRSYFSMLGKDKK